jgi:SAM-dependent methyltransferase
MERRLKQGQHPDPMADPPVAASWSPLHAALRDSPAMRAFAHILRVSEQLTVRESIVDDLASFYNLPPGEVVERCVNWEKWTVAEWQAARETDDPLRTFYETTRSWSFDLMWYAYLQLEGSEFPVSVAIADNLRGKGGELLDFGSGVGTTAQLFAHLGWQTTMADICEPLREFATYRWRRRGLTPRMIDLTQEELSPDSYDVITAIDTLHHVPNLDDVVPKLHAALRPGGLLFTNFEPRPATDENALHLYDDDLAPRWKLHRVGFEPEASLDGFVIRYRRTEPHGAMHGIRGARDLVLLRSPLRPAYRRLRYGPKVHAGR